jgi:integrase
LEAAIVPHHPKPFFRKPLGKWYVQIKGKQYNLGPDEPAAWEQYHALMAQKDALPDAKVITTELVVAVLDRFLDWVKANQAPKTYSWHHDHLQTFTGSIPRGLTVAELKPYHVTRAMDAQPTWGNNTKNGFARSVQRAFRWAEKVGLIDKNPIREVEKPGRERREDFITPAEFDDVLRRFPDQEFQDLLTAAWDTGARPAELFALEARHIDTQGSRWVFKASESKGKK